MVAKPVRNVTKPELQKQVRELKKQLQDTKARATDAEFICALVKSMHWTDDVLPDARKPKDPGVIVHGWRRLPVPPYVEPVWVTNTWCGYGHPQTLEEIREDSFSRLGYHSDMYSTEAMALRAQRHRMVVEAAAKLRGLDDRLEKLQA